MEQLNENLNKLNLSGKKGFITRSQKNLPQLCFEDHFFRLSNSDDANNEICQIIKWRCTYNTCLYKCHTNGCKIGEYYDILKCEGEHVEAPDTKKLAKLEYRRQLTELASKTEEAPRKIVTKAKSNFPFTDEEIASSASYDADRQFILRTQKANNPVYPKQPTCLANINIPHFLMNTISKTEDQQRKFLIYDSGPEDVERFFIFANIENFKLLENAHVFCDGTFDIAPKFFNQVYSIHALINGRCIPVVYVLLPRKTQQIYEKLLSKVKEHLNYNPKSFTSDFELGFINAVGKIFPDTPIYGCFFHFQQIMWRKIQELGLVTLYRTSEFHKRLLKLPPVLAFCSPDDIETHFNSIRNSIDQKEEKILEFYKFFEYNYIGIVENIKSSNRRNAKMIEHRREPLFNSSFWNVNHRLNENIPRTNNFVEAWHNSFSKMIRIHPLVYELIDWFRSEEILTKEKIILASTGVKYTRKPSYVKLDERIKIIIQNDSSNFMQLYDNLSLILEYK